MYPAGVSLLQSIIAKILVLTDDALSMFATTSGGSVQQIANTQGCGIGIMAANVTPCGTTLIQSIDALIVQGVGLLSGMVTALGAYNIANTTNV